MYNYVLALRMGLSQQRLAALLLMNPGQRLNFSDGRQLSMPPDILHLSFESL